MGSRARKHRDSVSSDHSDRQPPGEKVVVHILYAGKLQASGVRRVITELLGPNQLVLFAARDTHDEATISIPKEMVPAFRERLDVALRATNDNDVEVADWSGTLYVQRKEIRGDGGGVYWWNR